MLAAIPFLGLTLLLLPGAAWLGYRRPRGGSHEPPDALTLRLLAVQNIVTQVVVAAFAVLALWGTDRAVTWSSRLSPLAVAVAIASVGIAAAVSWIEARRPLAQHEVVRRALRRVASTDPLWIAVAVVAAVVEEFAYRGVLVLLLAAWTGSPVAWAVAAVAFGLGHLGSGPRAFWFSATFGAAMQVVVALSGGLLLAVLAHAAYDLLAAHLASRLGRNAA